MAAKMFMVSPRTAAKWAHRYRTEGVAGMTDRSSRPHHSPNRTPEQVKRQIVALRWRKRLGPVHRLDLPLDVPGALPAATDPNAPLPGSWVSSITFTADSALVGRTNVPFLQQFSLDMSPLATVPLPSGVAGRRP